MEEVWTVVMADGGTAKTGTTEIVRVKNGPHAPSLRVVAAPRGGFSSWGGPAMKNGPHAPSLRVVAAPRGGFSSWGGPANRDRGRSLKTGPLPHHPACGSAPGGSSS